MFPYRNRCNFYRFQYNRIACTFRLNLNIYKTSTSTIVKAPHIAIPLCQMLIFNKSGSLPLFCIFYSTCLCSRNRNKDIIFTFGSFYLNIVTTSWHIYSEYHTTIVVVSSLCIIQQLSVFVSNIEFCYTIFNYSVAIFLYFNTIYIYLSCWHSCCF